TRVSRRLASTAPGRVQDSPASCPHRYCLGCRASIGRSRFVPETPGLSYPSRPAVPGLHLTIDVHCDPAPLSLPISLRNDIARLRERVANGLLACKGILLDLHGLLLHQVVAHLIAHEFGPIPLWIKLN